MTQGQLTQVDGRWNVTFVRRLRHSPEKVWRALTEPEQLQAWFPTTIEGERRAGAPLKFSFEKQPFEPFTGEMLTCEPPSLLEFKWGGDVLRFELARDGDGTVLTLTDTLEELGKAARDSAGWHECLDNLVAHVNGVAPPQQPAAHWQELNASYVERFGPEASTIGPPEGWEPEQ